MKKIGKLIFYINLYFKVIFQDIKSKMSYRLDFFISIGGMLLLNFTELFSFWVVFTRFPSISGWTYHQIMFLYGFSLIALSTNQCFFENNWNLNTYLITGDFIKYCFRPVNTYFLFISEMFDVKGIGQACFGWVLLIYAWINLKLEFNITKVVLLLILLFSASLFVISTMNVAAGLNFRIMGSSYIMLFVHKFWEYVKYPISIYNLFFKVIFSILIPIGFVAYYPSLVLLDITNKVYVIIIAPILGILYFILSYMYWIRGAKKYSGTGS